MSKITPQRKVTYYVGVCMMIIGFLLFMSLFFMAALYMNNPFQKSPSFLNAFIGMALLIIGSIVASIGARGAAGSGLLLDPEKAREDLKPFNEAKGHMINDVISNIDLVEKISPPTNEKEVIKIRCTSCSALNDEDAKFCKSCGNEI